MSETTKVSAHQTPVADVTPSRDFAPRLQLGGIKSLTETPVAIQQPVHNEFAPRLGRDFSRIPIHPAATSCELGLAAPRACPFGGICHACPARVQAKLTVSQPDDKYEEEADRVADMVMSMPEPCPQCQAKPEETVQTRPVADQITPLVQRQVEPEKDEEEEAPVQAKSLLQRQVEHDENEEAVQTKSLTHQPTIVPSSLASRIQSLRGGGQPLPASVRAIFEPRFGYDFGQVRIHTDAHALTAARDVNAYAFTLGRDIVFGAGQYALRTMEGNRLLAHELTHVVQQARTEHCPSSGRFHQSHTLHVQKQSEQVYRSSGVAIRKVKVEVSNVKDGNALIAPYNSRQSLYDRAIYRVPTYRMTVSGTASDEVLAFKVVRFGMLRRTREPSPPQATRRCNTGLTTSKVFTPSWNAYYRPHSCPGTGRSGGWLLEGNRLIHEGPSPGCEVFGSTGCIEVAGQGEWNRFLATIERLSGATCARVSTRRALMVKLQAASRPFGQLTEG